MALSGKRIGGSCEPGAEAKAMQQQACATPGYTTAAWIESAEHFLRNTSMCPGKKDELCSAVRKDAPKDPDVYQLLLQAEDSNGGLIAKSCKLDMASITSSICAKVTDSNVQGLSKSCPAEAKKIMEARRKNAQSFSGDKVKSAASPGIDTAVKSGTDPTSGSSSSASSDSDSKSANPAGQLLDSAKKLKGMFGF
jgi:hypothetical protein